MTSHIAPIATHNDTHHVHLILLIKLNTISKSKLDGENTKFVGYPVYMADVITYQDTDLHSAGGRRGI